MYFTMYGTERQRQECSFLLNFFASSSFPFLLLFLLEFFFCFSVVFICLLFPVHRGWMFHESLNFFPWFFLVFLSQFLAGVQSAMMHNHLSTVMWRLSVTQEHTQAHRDKSMVRLYNHNVPISEAKGQSIVASKAPSEKHCEEKNRSSCFCW